MRSQDGLAATLDHAIDQIQHDPSESGGALVFVDARTAALVRDVHALIQAVVPRAEFCRTLEARLFAAGEDDRFSC